MNTLKKSFLFIGCFCMIKSAIAQNDIDAIRYSQTNISATARSLSMAGAFGALGADFSTLSTNPAGIALYRRSEFSFTPAIGNTITSTDYLGKNSSDNKYNFNLGNVGIVWAYPKENKNDGWKGFAFGLGYNRLNSFHSRSFYEGVNKNNSLLNSYVQQANSINADDLPTNFATQFSSDLAFETYLIDTFPGTLNAYFSSIPNAGELQRRTKETAGSNGEAVISFGANYNDKIFFGATLGFPFIRYNEYIIYEEIDPDHAISQTTPGLDSSYSAEFNFKSFALNQNVSTTGNGFNAKFGMIVRPNDWIRLGVALHTPTFYSMHDDYSSSITSEFENGASYSFGPVLGTYDYSLTTPLKFIGSAAFIYKQSGVLSVDYEYVDYTIAKFHSSDNSFAPVNDVIRLVYAQGSNIKAGAEWKYNIFAFRIGAGYFSPVLNKNNSTSNYDQHKIMYTGGLGIREQNYFVDLGYAYTQGNEAYIPYTASSDTPMAISKIKDHRFLLTVGFRF